MLLTILASTGIAAVVSVGLSVFLRRLQTREVRRLESVLARERALRRQADEDRASMEAVLVDCRDAMARADDDHDLQVKKLQLELAAQPRKRIEQLTKNRVIVHMGDTSIEGTLWEVYADSIVLRQAIFWLDDQTTTGLDGEQIIPLERIGWIQELASPLPVRIAASLATPE